MKRDFKGTLYRICTKSFVPLSALFVIDATFSNCYYLILSLSRALTDEERKLRMALIAVSLLFIPAGFLLIRFDHYDQAIKTLAKTQRHLFFHGYSIEQLVETRTLSRLQDWIGSRMCYELSILAMLQCRDFKSAKICRGYRKTKGLDTKIYHSWVEFKIPWNGWFILDFAWDTGRPRSKHNYLKRVVENDFFIKEWECDYSKFWHIKYSRRLYGAISSKKTSHILNCLIPYGQPGRGYEFRKIVYDPDLFPEEQDHMTPQTRVGSNRPITDDIIRAFAECPEITAPSHETVRKARNQLLKHEYHALFKPS